MLQFKALIGLDLSLQSFTAFLITPDEKFTLGPKKFKRTPSGIAEFLLWIEKAGYKPCEIKIVMEATNNFWEIVALKLDEAGVEKISVVNPRVIKDFARSLRRKAKTDDLDAEVIALYGVRMRPEETDLEKHKRFAELKSLTRIREFWIREKTRLSNYLRDLKRSMFAREKEIRWIEREIERIDKHIEEIEAEIEKVVKEDEQLDRAVDIMDSIPGVGRINGLVILVETGMFKGFRRSKEVVSYAGIVPRVYESGVRRGDKGITREGNRRLRTAVYFAAVASLRSKCEKFKEFYERLISRGKAKKVALIALAGKILRIAYALWKKGEHFEAAKLATT